MSADQFESKAHAFIQRRLLAGKSPLATPDVVAEAMREQDRETEIRVLLEVKSALVATPGHGNLLLLIARLDELQK